MPLDPGLEERVRALLAANDVAGASAALVRGYGAELYAFFRARLATPEDADDALGSWCEDVLRGLPAFRGDASLRTWSYRVARNRASHMRRGDGRRWRRILDGGTDAADKLAWEVRTTTAAFQKTDVKDHFRALVSQLDEDDQEVIALHSGLRASGTADGNDGEPTFKEIAVLCADEELAPAEVTKRAALFRKRYERATTRLRALYLAAKPTED